jgi:predicted Zn-ribbon and HTH transcriptional regulator
VVAFYTRQRGLDFEPDPNRDNVFSCEECEYVYTDDDDVERSRCPECGVMNRPVVF